MGRRKGGWEEKHRALKECYVCASVCDRPACVCVSVYSKDVMCLSPCFYCARAWINNACAQCT